MEQDYTHRKRYRSMDSSTFRNPVGAKHKVSFSHAGHCWMVLQGVRRGIGVFSQYLEDGLREIA